MATLTGEYLEHRTKQGERWDLLAYRYYGDPAKQTLILEANRSLYLDNLAVPPLLLSAGITLKIPIVQEEATNTTLLPPWKRNGSYS